jgi:hypothetical protein
VHRIATAKGRDRDSPMLDLPDEIRFPELPEESAPVLSKLRAEQKVLELGGREGAGRQDLSPRIARGERIPGFNSAISGNGEMRGNAVRASFADNRCSPSFSGWPPLVAVVKTGDLRNRHNSSEVGRLHYPRFRRGDNLP